jgi:hypothetical protein
MRELRCLASGDYRRLAERNLVRKSSPSIFTMRNISMTLT